MKKIALLLTIGIFCTSVHCQTWFDSTDNWVYRYSEGYSAIEGYSEYSNVRDTFVNGLDAKAIDGYFLYYSYQFERRMEHRNTTVYYEKDDRVYSINHIDSMYLIYDFNLKVGDSISYPRPEICGNMVSKDTLVCHLDSIGSVNLNNQELLIQHFSFYDNISEFEGTLDVIETIGATNSNFNLYSNLACPAFHPEYENLCMFSSLSEEINLLSEDCFFVISSVNNIELETYSIFPNPVNKILTIKTELTNYSIKVYNLNGEILNVYPEDNTIDISALNSGIYILELVSQDQRAVYKILKS